MKSIMKMMIIMLIAGKNRVKLIRSNKMSSTRHSNTTTIAARTEMRKTMMVLVD